MRRTLKHEIGVQQFSVLFPLWRADEWQVGLGWHAH